MEKAIAQNESGIQHNNYTNNIINNLFKARKSNSTKLIKANYRKNATTYKNPKFTINFCIIYSSNQELNISFENF